MMATMTGSIMAPKCTAGNRPASEPRFFRGFPLKKTRQTKEFCGQNISTKSESESQSESESESRFLVFSGIQDPRSTWKRTQEYRHDKTLKNASCGDC
jgi:hypothetical protein